MKKLIIFFALIGFCAPSLLAQEEAVFMHYIFNPVLVNPAATGFDETNHDVFINIRSAWTNFPESPKTYALSYNGPIGNRLGLGAMLYTENVAAMSRYRAQLSYSFRYQIKEVKMALGLSTEWHRMTLNNNLSSSAFFNQYLEDSVIEEAMDGVTDFDATLGLYGSYKDLLFFGVSSPGLIRGELDRIEGIANTGPFQFFTLNFGGNFEVGDSKVKLQPSVLLKKVRNVDFQADFNLLASFLKEQLITGLTFRGGTGGNLGIILGTKYSAVRFIYTYDVYMGDFQRYNGGTHEITINFEFERKKGNADRSAEFR